MWLYVTLSIVKFRENCDFGKGVRRMNNAWGLFASVSIYGADTHDAMRGEAGEVRKRTNECTPAGARALVCISNIFFNSCVNMNSMTFKTSNVILSIFYR